MLFNSFDYLFLFLPTAFLIYWKIKNLRIQNLFIVSASYLFYACWDWRFLLLIMLSTFSSWCSGCLMERYKAGQRPRSIIFALNLIINLGILAFFKYFNFFANSLAAMLSPLGIELDYPTLNIILPVGISFYTFQAIGYSIDIYKQKIQPCRSLLDFSAFICFFPQLVAGPIESASHLLPQFLQPRRFSYKEGVKGCRLILWGLFKKMAVADNCAITVDMVWSDYANYSPAMLTVASLLFTMQIYCDFSGYSDIAVGSAKLFGIDLIQNFKTPYFSTSIPEFWRRWHISLTEWFRTYIYIPLGGSREGKYTTIRNTFIIFALSGLWHGANYTFIIWGLYYAVLSMPYALFNIRTKRTTENLTISPRELPAMLITLFLVNLGWIIFRAPDLQSATAYIARMFSFNSDISDLSGITAIGLSLLCITVEWVQRNRAYPLEIDNCRLFASPRARAVVYYAILAILLGLQAQQESFIYFQF